jgi:hypothetical protein
MDAVRAAEQALTAERAGSLRSDSISGGPITADEWRRHLS